MSLARPTSFLFLPGKQGEASGTAVRNGATREAPGLGLIRHRSPARQGTVRERAFSNCRCGPWVMKAVLCFMTIILSYTEEHRMDITETRVRSTRSDSVGGNTCFGTCVCTRVRTGP